MSEMINEQEVLSNSQIKSVVASTPERCDSVVDVTITIDRKQGDTNLTIQATLADPTKVGFVNAGDANPITVPANNIVVIQVKNVTGSQLTNATIFSSIKLFKQSSKQDEKNNQPTVTWPACPVVPCDDCCKCDCSQDINIAKCDAVTDSSIDTTIKCSGRILKLTVNIKNVCPNRKIALAAFITENDALKGVRFKEITSGGAGGGACQDVSTTLCFVLPDDNACADARTLKARVIANYVDLGSHPIPCCCQS